MLSKHLGKNDNRGVSPVIGVILMVAITVILAAVIGSFVLGIGGDIEKAPQASISYDANNDNLVHQGGDTLEAGSYYAAGTDTVGGGTPGEWAPGEIKSYTDDNSDGVIRIVDNSTGSVIAEVDI